MGVDLKVLWSLQTLVWPGGLKRNPTVATSMGFLLTSLVCNRMWPYVAGRFRRHHKISYTSYTPTRPKFFGSPAPIYFSTFQNRRKVFWNRVQTPKTRCRKCRKCRTEDTVVMTLYHHHTFIPVLGDWWNVVMRSLVRERMPWSHKHDLQSTVYIRVRVLVTVHFPIALGQEPLRHETMHLLYASLHAKGRRAMTRSEPCQL